jgi:alpha-glucosidase (family GH31 glycosyl hydrolase)
MERELDFTLSQERYSQLPNYIQELHDKGMKFITIIDPGISNGEITGTYPAYDLGNLFDVWIKVRNTGKTDEYTF